MRGDCLGAAIVKRHIDDPGELGLDGLLDIGVLACPWQVKYEASGVAIRYH